MLASVTQQGAEGRIESVGDRDAEVGTSLFYAGFQQFGTSKIPSRRFLWLDSPSVDAVLEVFADKAFQIVIGG
jgi:phage gpG-like protein